MIWLAGDTIWPAGDRHAASAAASTSAASSASRNAAASSAPAAPAAASSAPAATAASVFSKSSGSCLCPKRASRSSQLPGQGWG